MHKSPGDEFEYRVREICRILWNPDGSQGAIASDGCEIDGVYITDEVVHIVECTISKTQKKAEEDALAIGKTAKSLRSKYSDKVFKGWFITKDEPTHDQRTVITENESKNGVKIFPLSLSTLCSTKLYDAKSYFQLRDNHPFGSIRDPESNYHTNALEYIQATMHDTCGIEYGVNKIAKELLKGGDFCILGDYGAGKSMTSLEVYKTLRTEYLKGRTSRFPIYINLRECSGQKDADEIFFRHARAIGFKDHDLLRAWKADFCTIILDGFDEISTSGISRDSNRHKTRRFVALEGVRKIISLSKPNTGILISGRYHYFSGDKEFYDALGVDSTWKKIDISDYSDEQIEKYIKHAGSTVKYPKWLPKRPLLVGYLIKKDIITKLDDGANTPAQEWDKLLDLICQRESTTESNLDAKSIRFLIERLATEARKYDDGIGEFTEDDIDRVYLEAFKEAPDSYTSVIIQRLPGLGIANPEKSTRKFIDYDLCDVARTGDVTRFIFAPWDQDLQNLFHNISSELGELSSEILQRSVFNGTISVKLVEQSIENAHANKISDYLLYDLFTLLHESGAAIKRDVTISECRFLKFEQRDNVDYSKISFANVLFDSVVISGVNTERLPNFSNCYISVLEGATKFEIESNPKFIDPIIEEFSLVSETAAAINDEAIPESQKAMKICLRKLYFQRGGGRQESAFFRGIPQSLFDMTRECLDYLISKGYAEIGDRGTSNIYIPTSEGRVEALNAINRPNDSKILREIGAI